MSKMHLINEIHFWLNGTSIINWRSICVLFLLGKYLQLSFLGYISQDLLSGWLFFVDCLAGDAAGHLESFVPFGDWNNELKSPSSWCKVCTQRLAPPVLVNHSSSRRNARYARVSRWDTFFFSLWRNSISRTTHIVHLLLPFTQSDTFCWKHRKLWSNSSV